MELTDSEYKQFVSQYTYLMNGVKKWLNEQMQHEGVFFPFGVEEFYTTVQFQESQMHIMLEVEEEAEKFFEDKYWEKQ